MELLLSTLPEPIREIPSDLTPVLKVLTTVEGSFFVLARRDSDFIQGAPNPDGYFQLEYSEDSSEGLHEYQQPLSLDAVADIARRYLEGDDTWKEDPEWEHFVIEEVAEEEDGSLGFFDGLGLRRVISELEKNDIEVRVEAQENGFNIFTTPAKVPLARQVIADLFPA